MKLRFFLLFLFVLGLFFVLPQKIFASSESIKSFRSNITLHKDGSFNVEENIQYDFGENLRHGIFRYIPLTSRVGEYYRTLKITFLGVQRDGQPEKFSENDSNGKAYIKIGDANETISGVHDYTINYNVENGIGNFSDHDELFWNVTGNDWQVPIEKVSSQIFLDFNTQITKATCYTGITGSREQNCDTENISNIVTTSPLSENQGLTVVFGFPAGTFPLSKIDKNPPGTINPVVLSILFIIFIIFALAFYIVLPIILIIWYFRSKRINRFGPITVNFDIPKNERGDRIPPAEAGTIDSAKLEKDDVIATIFDLAIRKYIKIKEIEKKKILGFGGGKDYLISKIKNYEKEKLTLYEKDLLDALFSESDEIELGSISKSFYKTFSDMDDHVFSSLIKRGYYKKNPKTQRGLLIAGGVISFLMINFVLGFILLFFSRVLNGRTATGDEIDWRIDGLKLFLKSMDRNYKWQAEQLAIVESMIPYAIALSYIDKFMEQLKIVKPDYRPNWYSGNTAFYLASTNMFTSMNSSFVTTAPSSASGFSGGGSSGGGGGGGGGGSW
ncbi:MAG: DUF2207 domain-containing protein [Patescibacteria group bacterium]|nr:DUF2207 domain-containing protein [Patescibacteria group bacterium]